jgi:hypothetical protein
MTSQIAEKVFPDSIAIKKGKRRPTILKDEHVALLGHPHHSPLPQPSFSYLTN